MNLKIPINMIIDNARNIKSAFTNYSFNNILNHYLYAVHIYNMGGFLKKCTIFFSL